MCWLWLHVRANPTSFQLSGEWALVLWQLEGQWCKLGAEPITIWLSKSQLWRSRASWMTDRPSLPAFLCLLQVIWVTSLPAPCLFLYTLFNRRLWSACFCSPARLSCDITFKSSFLLCCAFKFPLKLSSPLKNSQWKFFLYFLIHTDLVQPSFEKNYE